MEHRDALSALVAARDAYFCAFDGLHDKSTQTEREVVEGLKLRFNEMNRAVGNVFPIIVPTQKCLLLNKPVSYPLIG